MIAVRDFMERLMDKFTLSNAVGLDLRGDERP